MKRIVIIIAALLVFSVQFLNAGIGTLGWKKMDIRSSVQYE